MATYYVDFENGNDANNGSSWALARKTFLTSYAAGSIIKIAKTADRFASGVDAVFVRDSSEITTVTPLTKSIELCSGNTWTASPNVTAANGELRYGKLSTVPQKLTIATAFTTGKIAYKTLGSEIDLSAYTKVCLWLATSNVTGGLNSAGSLRLCLCSDTSGDVVVHTFTFPAMSRTNLCIPFTFDNTTGLGASIKSVAIYANNEIGTPAITLCNIFATNELTLSHLVGKNDTVSYAIRNVIDNVIQLDTAYAWNYVGYYAGVSETTALYLRKPLEMTLSSAGASLLGLNAATTNYELPTEFQFGFNPATDLQDGETCIDGVYFYGYAVTFNSQIAPVKISNLNVFRYSIGLKIDSAYKTFLNCNVNCCNINIQLVVGANYCEFININSTAGYISQLDIASCNNKFKDIRLGLSGYSSHKNLILGPSANDNYFDNILLGAFSLLQAVIFSGQGTVFYNSEFLYPFNLGSATNGTSGDVTFINCIIPEWPQISDLNDNFQFRIINLNNIEGNNFYYINGTKLWLDNADTPAGVEKCWVIENFWASRTESYPINIKIAEIAVEANVTILIKVLSKTLDSSKAKLFVKNAPHLGIFGNKYSEDYIPQFNTGLGFGICTVIVTPTKEGVLELYVSCWAKTLISTIEIVS